VPRPPVRRHLNLPPLQPYRHPCHQADSSSL
jgi:hypothetical protein